MMIGPERFGLVELPLCPVNVDGSPLLELAGEEPCATGDHHEIESLVTASVEVPVTVECSTWGEKMPFHHVRSTLLYTGSLLSRTLSEGSEAFQITSISTEELGEIRQAFRVLDRDGNGFISKQELGMAMRSLGYMPSEVELAIIMQRLDMDGDGQVDFEEFVTILGPKLLSAETREGFRGSTIDNIFWQFDMQQMSLDELKQILFHAFQDHLTMKDIENIIINEEESLNETGNCPEYEGGEGEGGQRGRELREGGERDRW
eukprot:XP_014051374.1 PREDICTED: calcium-binding protein 8-like isoform X1 [Salmo salar]